MIERQTTKALLAESLKELSKSKNVDKITIRELTANCGLTSPTFYNHFHDKYELMAWIYNQKVEASLKDFGVTNSNKKIPFRLWRGKIFFIRPFAVLDRCKSLRRGQFLRACRKLRLRRPYRRRRVPSQ